MGILQLADSVQKIALRYPPDIGWIHLLESFNE